MRLLFDCDLTVVDTGSEWRRWLEEVTGVYKYLPEDNIDYNLASYWKEELEAFDIDGLDFWRSPMLYSNLSPIKEAEEFISSCYKAGHEIVFVSAIKGNHLKSKYYWLKQHFPYMSGALFTKEKWLVQGDAIFDDRWDILNKMPEGMLRFSPLTPYKQCVHPDRNVIHYEWKKLGQVLEQNSISF